MENINGNIVFEHAPCIASYASTVGKKEGEGPLREFFDRVLYDSYAGRDTFEQAESQIMSTAVRMAMDKARLAAEDVDLACCGDLLNQCVASSFAMRQFGIPYAGVYGACSTMALSMITASIAVDSGAARRAICAASSHYCTAERQYRFPLEYGSQRPPTAQWTVTGAGACIIEGADNACDSLPAEAMDPCRIEDNYRFAEETMELRRTGDYASMPKTHRVNTSVSSTKVKTDLSTSCCKPALRAARLGRIVDYNISDQNNMGAAMAPANVKPGTIPKSIKTA